MVIIFTECSCATWGPRCNQTCHCLSGSCNHVTGSCDNGCAHGWSGDNCQERLVQGLCTMYFIILCIIYVLIMEIFL